VSGEEMLRVLREALATAPENVALRRHLAEALLRAGRAGEAEEEYRRALSGAPGDPTLKLGLARAFHRQGKSGNALVLVEDLVRGPDAPAEARVLYSRLLYGGGEVESAVREYRLAMEADSAVGDEEFETLLGIGGVDRDPREEVVEGRVRTGWEAPDGGEGDVERPRVSFEDVGGMEQVKDEIRMKIIHPVRHADLYRAYGKAAGGGILMYGPPGCGKTHLARATAGEMGSGFLAVGINDVLEMWLGNSERNLHALFEVARASRSSSVGGSRNRRRALRRRLLIEKPARLRGSAFLFAEVAGPSHRVRGPFLAVANHVFGVGRDLVAAGAAIDHVPVFDPSDVRALGVDDIVPAAAGHSVLAEAAAQVVVAGATAQGVVSVAAEQPIGAATAGHGVIPVAGEQLIGAAQADDRVLAA
jgi:hypothetical protein